jgi:hypothetical protein
MKKALAFIAQFVLFAAVFVATPVLAIFDPWHLKHWFVSHPTLTSTRYFSPEGFLLMVALYLLILAIEAATKHLRTAGTITTIAFVVVLVCGVLLRWGWATNELF